MQLIYRVVIEKTNGNRMSDLFKVTATFLLNDEVRIYTKDNLKPEFVATSMTVYSNSIPDVLKHEFIA